MLIMMAVSPVVDVLAMLEIGSMVSHERSDVLTHEWTHIVAIVEQSDMIGEVTSRNCSQGNPIGRTGVSYHGV